jgi:3-deoxy-manno-octulosonate cytidylyltransferase (CMP-KDO synthetase)
MSFNVIIPARYQSSRLPAKPLADIAGKPMIQHVVEQALRSDAKRVVVATDDQRIADVVTGFGGDVVLTRADHESGTERLAEVVERLQWPADEVVVNVQGDEPMIPPSVINQVAQLLRLSAEAPMATLAAPIHLLDDILNPNVVKLVCDKQGNALYFSRAGVPFSRDGDWAEPVYLRHIGLYAYRAGFIAEYVKMPPSALEQIEKLEQLRVLWHGYKIKVATAVEVPPHGVDTQEDLEAVRRHFMAQNL